MKLVCPICGAHGSAELFASDADTRAACEILARLPGELGPLVLVYLGLFRPGKRALAWGRVRTLLAELEPLIKAGYVTRNGRAWQTPTSAWRAALQHMADTRAALRLPLKGHGYLLEVLTGTAQSQDAREETARHRAALERGRAPAQHGEPVTVGMTDIVARSVIAAENRVRARMQQPPLTPAEEQAFLANQP